jgi:hypothetical protein
MKAIIAVSVLVVVLAVIFIVVNKDGGTSSASSKTIETYLLDCVDTSPSNPTTPVTNKEWHIRLYSLLDPDTWLTFYRLTSENIAAIYMMKGLPEPDKIDVTLFAHDKERGTRPLRFLEDALAVAKQNSDKQIVIAFFTDGQNDYQSDEKSLYRVCRNLIEQPNVVRIGIFGLDPIDKRKVADWNSWFAGTDKVIICTRMLGSTEQGIGRFCDEINQEAAVTAARMHAKGGK